ncbi:GntR family transcriptional regulator [Amycolatopsis sp. cg5]|uniref:GntR family transcriptional regulator n=1 Tax=Amycolatopsis sp. cg5 TaxID=3238802 RepID=UPI0035258703
MSADDTWVSVSMPYVTGEVGDAWAVEAAQHSRKGTHKLLGVAEEPASAEVAEMLRLKPGENVTVRRRLVLLDDHPVELADSYYPSAIAQGTRLADARKIPGGAVAHLAELGYPPHRLREDVGSRLADAHERAALRLPDPASVLMLFRVLLTADDQPVEASIMTMTGSGRRLRYELSF